MSKSKKKKLKLSRFPHQAWNGIMIMMISGNWASTNDCYSAAIGQSRRHGHFPLSVPLQEECLPQIMPVHYSVLISLSGKSLYLCLRLRKPIIVTISLQGCVSKIKGTRLPVEVQKSFLELLVRGMEYNVLFTD